MDSDKTKAWEYLKNNHLAVLATISSHDGNPQASLVFYVTDDDFYLYLVINQDSRKMQNIAKNNHVALVIGQENKPMSMQVVGTAEILEDSEKKDIVAKQYLDIAKASNPNSPNWPPIMKIRTLTDFVFLKITIDWCKFSDFQGSEAYTIEGNPTDWK